MCVRFFLLWTLLGILTLAFAAPARAAEFCDTYPSQIPPAELQTQAIQLKHGFPASHAELLSGIRLVNKEERSSLGLRLRSAPGRNPSIEIPNGFRRIQCKLFLVEYFYMRGCCDRKADLSKIVHDCHERDRNLPRCVEEFLDDRLLKIGADYSPEFVGLFKQLADAAFRYTLAHEAAHLLLNRSAAHGDVETNLDNETAADVLALLSVVVEGNIQLASIAPEAMLSVADSSTDWRRAAHPPSACRAQLSDRIVLKIGPEIGQAYGWLLEPDRYAESRRKQRRVETTTVFIPGDTSHCDQPDPAAIEAVRGDFDRILAALDRAPVVGRDRLPPEAVVSRLMAFPLATGEGKRLRTNLLSLWVFKEAKIDAEGESAPALRWSAARLDRLTALFDPREMSSEAYGRVEVNRALIRYFQGAPGSSLRAMNARLRRDLDLAARYYANSGYALKYQGNIAFMEGRCEDGRIYFQKRLDLDPQNTALIAELRPYLSSTSQRACLGIAQEFRRRTKVQFGWTD